MVGSRGAESDATCWHISAHISTCRHISACSHVLTHTSMEVRSKWLVSVMTRVMLHVGMSKCADTCQHADKDQMVCIRDAESDGSCWHMSPHISPCRHISAHVGMSKCADTCQHAGKLQMVCIRRAESDAICWHMSAHISTCRHISACPHVLAYVSMQIRSKSLVS